MDELLKYQESVIETINRENEKYEDFKDVLNLDTEIKKAQTYINKLVQLKKDFVSIKEKSENIKQRSIKLQEKKQKEALKIESTKDKQKQLDKQLMPVVVSKNKSKK